MIYRCRTKPKDWCVRVRRSKLESYEAILEALVKKPLTIDNIAYESDIECSVLKRHLEFLMKNGLAEERPGKKTRYAITERGMAVFKALNFQKYIEKVAKSLRLLDDALQAVPVIANSNSGKEEPED